MRRIEGQRLRRRLKAKRKKTIENVPAPLYSVDVRPTGSVESAYGLQPVTGSSGITRSWYVY